MANETWSYLIDTFEVNTRNSHKKGMSLAVDHKAKLEASGSTDPEVSLWHTEFEPILGAYVRIDSQYNQTFGTRKGKTNAFEEAMQQLNTEIKIWEGPIRAKFPEDSPVEIEIFPNKRQPFQTGTYEGRIQAVRTLSEKLKEYPDLATVQLQVELFYNNLLASRESEQNYEGAQAQLSVLREEQRVVVMKAMYGNLGRAMYKYRSNPDMVTTFFDLGLLRSTGEDVKNLIGTAAAESIINVDYGTIEFTADTPVMVKNTSAQGVSLQVYFGTNAGEEPGSISITAQPGAFVEVTAGELGFDDANVFLNIKNTAAQGGSFEILVG